MNQAESLKTKQSKDNLGVSVQSPDQQRLYELPLVMVFQRLSSVLRSKLTMVFQPLFTKYACDGVAGGLPVTLSVFTLQSFLQIRFGEH